MTDAVVRPTNPKDGRLEFYCAALYERMESESTIEVVDDKSVKVWSGALLATCRSIGIPDGSYKRVIDALRRLKCLEQLSVGKRNTPSVFLLQSPPGASVWEQARGELKGLTQAPTLDRLSGEVETLREQIKTQLGGLNIVEALIEIEKRLSKVEKRLKENSPT